VGENDLPSSMAVEMESAKVEMLTGVFDGVTGVFLPLIPWVVDVLAMSSSFGRDWLC